MMEKAIVKTLCYSDIFDYPLKSWEIHKWLIGKQCSLSDLEKPLSLLLKKGIIESSMGYFVLKGRRGLIKKRQNREFVSRQLFNKAWFISRMFKIIPWIKLVGISGSLAVNNADQKDDIDLFIVTEKNRVWLSRLLLLIILSGCGIRRKKRENSSQSAGKVCINIILNIDSLEQHKKNIYIAHEVLQMKILWLRGSLYEKYLEANSWAFKYLPNWISTARVKSQESRIKDKKQKAKLSFSSKARKELCSLRDPVSWRRESNLSDYFEQIARLFQKKYMGTPSGKERISDSALYFHPEDYTDIILSKYKQSLRTTFLKQGLKKLKI